MPKQTSLLKQQKATTKKKSRKQYCEFCRSYIVGRNLSRHKNRHHSYKKKVKLEKLGRTRIPFPDKRSKEKSKTFIEEAEEIAGNVYPFVKGPKKRRRKNADDLVAEITNIRPRPEKLVDRALKFSEKVLKMDFEEAVFMTRKKRDKFLSHCRKLNPNTDILTENIYSLRAYRYFTQMLMCKNRVLDRVIQEKKVRLTELNPDICRSPVEFAEDVLPYSYIDMSDITKAIVKLNTD